jgi:TolB-like protein
VEAAGVQRFVVLGLAFLCGCALLAAAPAPSILGTPIVIVYPFTVNGGDVSKEAGSRLAVTIATQIANLGGVDVRPAPAGTERQNYLDAAHHEGADYYIAGYVTPLGDGVSVVEQLVSTTTGIVVYSNTAQVRTYADAAGQGDVLRDAVLRHQTRNLGAYAAPPPPDNTPAPTATAGTGAQANLGRLFGHKQRTSSAASPAPSSTPTAVALAAPSPAAAPLPSATAQAVAAVAHGPDFGVLSIGGTAAGELRSFTGAAIRNDIIASHRRAMQLDGTPQTACRADSIGTLLGGNLATRNHTILGQAQTTATLELLAYDCAGNVVYRKTFAHDARGDWKTAVDRVVASAVAEFLREPARRS